MHADEQKKPEKTRNQKKRFQKAVQAITMVHGGKYLWNICFKHAVKQKKKLKDGKH